MNIRNNLRPVENVFQKSNEIKNHLENNYQELLNHYSPVYSLRKCENSEKSNQFYLQIIFTELQSRKFIEKPLPLRQQEQEQQQQQQLQQGLVFPNCLEDFIRRNFKRNGPTPQSAYFEKVVHLLNFFYSYTRENKSYIMQRWIIFNRNNDFWFKNTYQQYFEETIRTGNYYYLSENEIVEEGRIFKINDDFHLFSSIYSTEFVKKYLSAFFPKYIYNYDEKKNKITIKRGNLNKQNFNLDQINIPQDKINSQREKLNYLRQLFIRPYRRRDQQQYLNRFLQRTDLEEFDYYLVDKFHELFYLPSHDKRKNKSKLVNIGYLKKFKEDLKKMSRENKIVVEEYPLFNDSLISTEIRCKENTLCKTQTENYQIDRIYNFLKVFLTNFFAAKTFFKNVPFTLNFSPTSALGNFFSSSKSLFKSLFTKSSSQFQNYTEKKIEKQSEIYLSFLNHMIILYLVYEYLRPIHTINIIFHKRDKDFKELGELGSIVDNNNRINPDTLVERVISLDREIRNFLGFGENPVITMNLNRIDRYLDITFSKDINNVVHLKSFFSKILDLYDHQGDKDYDDKIQIAIRNIQNQKRKLSIKQRQRRSPGFYNLLASGLKDGVEFFTGNMLTIEIDKVIDEFDYIYTDDVIKISRNEYAPEPFTNYLQNHHTIIIRDRIWKIDERGENITFRIYFENELKHPKNKAQYKQGQVQIGNHINDRSHRQTIQEARSYNKYIRFIKKTDFYRRLPYQTKRTIITHLSTGGNNIQTLLNSEILSNLEKSNLTVELNRILEENITKQRPLTDDQTRNFTQQTQRNRNLRNFDQNLPGYI